MIGNSPIFTPFKNVSISRHLSGPFDDVLALVAAFWKRCAISTSDKRRNKKLHLCSAIVEIILAINVVTATFEYAGQRVAVGRASSMTGVKRTSGIRTHELQQNSRTLTGR